MILYAMRALSVYMFFCWLYVLKTFFTPSLCLSLLWSLKWFQLCCRSGIPQIVADPFIVQPKLSALKPFSPHSYLLLSLFCYWQFMYCMLSKWKDMPLDIFPGHVNHSARLSHVQIWKWSCELFDWYAGNIIHKIGFHNKYTILQ